MSTKIRPRDAFWEIRRLADPAGFGVTQFYSLPSAQQYRWPYEVTQEQVAPGSHVLDWGAGNGHFSQFLLLAGHRVSAFAFGPPSPLLAALMKTHPDDLSYAAGDEAEPTKLPYPDSSFDAVVSVGVLEHVRETGGDEVGSLREIHRVLKPGGKFLCFHFPNRLSWIERATFFFRSRFHHQHTYSRRDIVRFAEAARFELICVRRYNAIPRNGWAHLPARLRPSERLASCIDITDTIAGAALNPFCQNYGFVLKKGS